MIIEIKGFALKLLCLAIVAPLLASSLLHIIGKIENAWKINSKRKKFYALTMLMVFMGVCLGWTL